MKQLIKNIVRWARITKAGSDDKQFATQQMEYLGKVADGIIVFPYGLHGNVPADSLALMFAVQGNPDNRAAIAWTPKDRPKLADGEVAFYHPPTDAFIIWRTSGDLDIETGNTGTANVNIKCKDLTVNASGDANINCVNSTLTATGNADISCVNSTITATTKVTFDTPLGNFTGALVVDGLITGAGYAFGGGSGSVAGVADFTGTIKHSGVDIGKGHGHTQANDSGGNTEANTGGVV